MAAYFLNSGSTINLAKVIEDLRERDLRDSSREHSPLKISSNAHLIDTTELSIETAIARAIELVGLVRKKL